MSTRATDERGERTSGTAPAPRGRRRAGIAHGPSRSGLAAPLRVAWARARARPWRGLLVAAGFAAATALLAGALGGSLVAGEQRVQRALEALPSDQRAFSVEWSGVPPTAGYASIDRRAHQALRLLTPTEPSRALAYRQTSIGNHVVQLAAIGDLQRYVTLLHGRLPRSCTTARCEVLQVGGPSLARAADHGINLVRVGTGVLRTDLPLGESSFSRAHGATAQAQDNGVSAAPPLYVAGDLQGLSTLPALGLIYRTYRWAAPIDPRSTHAYAIAGLLRRETAAQNVLVDPSGLFGLSAPDDVLTAAQGESSAAQSRMLVVAGEAAALLLAFVLLAAGGLRRDFQAEWRRLQRRGARRSQLVLFAIADAGWITLLGVLAGTVAAAIALTVAAGRTHLDAWTVIQRSLLSAQGLLLGLLCLVVGTAVLIAAQLAPEGGRRGGWLRPLDVAALGAVGALILAGARGATGAQALHSDGSIDPLVPLLPVLLAFVAGVVILRAIGPAFRLLERGSRRGPLASRLAILTLARDPARAALAVAFLAVSVGLAVFATAYRSTLEQGQRDQAAYQVPLDYTLSEGSQLVRPLAAAPLQRYAALPGVTAYPVMRTAADLPGSGTQRQGAVVLGVPAAAIPQIAGWRSDFAGPSQRALAALLAAGPGAARGVTIPAGPQTLSLPAKQTGQPVDASIVLRAAGRDPQAVALRWRGDRLEARLPDSPVPRTLLGLVLRLPFAAALAAGHADAEGGLTAWAGSGALSLGPLTANGKAVTDWRGWGGHDGLHRVSGAGTRLRYAITINNVATLRLPQPSDTQPLPVLATPAVAQSAGAGGDLTLSFDGAPIAVHVAAVIHRFPTTQDAGGVAIVADEGALQAALSTTGHGGDGVSEVWLRRSPTTPAASLERTLAASPFSALDLQSRRSLLDGLSSDPLARGILLTLGAAALLALVLALTGIVLTTASALRDERAELFDLEAQGVQPGTLRAQLRLRAALVTVLGIVLGVLVGLLLARAVVGLVLVSANDSPPVPPLRAVTTWLLVGPALIVLALVALAACEAVVRRSFHEPVPQRPTGAAP